MNKRRRYKAKARRRATLVRAQRLHRIRQFARSYARSVPQLQTTTFEVGSYE